MVYKYKWWILGGLLLLLAGGYYFFFKKKTVEPTTEGVENKFKAMLHKSLSTKVIQQ